MSRPVVDHSKAKSRLEEPHQRVMELLTMKYTHLTNKSGNLLVNIFVEDCEPCLPRCVVRAWRAEYTAIEIATAQFN